MIDDDDVAARDAEFAALFRRFLTDVVHRADAGSPALTALGELVSQHLGVDARTLAVVEESIPAHRLADLDAAFDAIAGPDDCIVGVSGGQQKRFASLVEMISGGGMPFGEAPVDYVSVDVGPGEQRSVVGFGLRLMTVDSEPVVALQRAADPQHGRVLASVELLARDRSRAASLLAALRTAMNEHSVLRGKVLTFSQNAFDYGTGAISFLPRPDVPAESVVLPEGALARLREHIIGIREHAPALRAAGAHLKRGALLYGPPGTGKTLTVNHLVSHAEGVTTVLLTGPSIRFITEAAQLARAMSPSLVVLEDVDLIAHERDMHGSPQPLLFAVLDALDGLDGDADVAFVMTTNRVELLERALVERPGRVDLAVEIPLPDADARRRLFAIYAGGAPFSDAAVAEAADRCEGVTGSFAKELVRRALLRAATAGEAPSDEHLRQATAELLDDREALTRRLVGGAEGAEASPWEDDGPTGYGSTVSFSG